MGNSCLKGEPNKSAGHDCTNLGAGDGDGQPLPWASEDSPKQN